MDGGDRSEFAIGEVEAGAEDFLEGLGGGFEEEMEEIAATFEAAGLPSGVHEAAAEIYRALAPFKDDPDAPGGAELARFLVDRMQEAKR